MAEFGLTLLSECQRGHLRWDQEGQSVDREAVEEGEELDCRNHGVELCLAGIRGHSHPSQEIQKDALHKAARDDAEPPSHLIDQQHDAEDGDERDNGLDQSVEKGL